MTGREPSWSSKASSAARSALDLCSISKHRLWKRYLGPFAQIIGIDIDPACKALEEDQISIRIGDQGDPRFLQQIIDEFGIRNVKVNKS